MGAPGSGRSAGRVADILEELLVELPARVRGGGTRLSEQALGVVHSLIAELNLVTRDDLDELELRLAQVEHRLRLLETERDLPAP